MEIQTARQVPFHSALASPCRTLVGGRGTVRADLRGTQRRTRITVLDTDRPAMGVKIVTGTEGGQTRPLPEPEPGAPACSCSALRPNAGTKRQCNTARKLYCRTGAKLRESPYTRCL